VSDTPQGEGWWQASDGKWYPPEQAPGYQEPQQGYAQPAAAGGGGGTVSVGEALSYGWQKYQANVGQLLVAAIIGFVIMAVLGAIGYFAVFAGAIGGSGTIECDFNEAGVYECTGGGGTSFIIFLLGLAVFYGLMLFGQYVFQLLMFRAGLMVTEGRSPELSDLMSGTNVGSYLIASLIMSVGVGIGIMLCVIPGLLLAFFGYFFGFYILDKGVSPIDGIKGSIELVRNNIGTVLVFIIAAFALNAVGAMVCYIGLLVTVPMTSIAGAWVYKQMDGQPVAA